MKSLASWKADHQRYFERNGVFDPQMMLVWEAVSRWWRILAAGGSEGPAPRAPRSI